MNKVDIVGMIRLPWISGNHVKDRNFLRKLLINIFSEENPGNGGGNLASKYEYIVERTSVGEVYLRRPAHLKKGFDFVIHLRNWNFNGKTNPKHEDIIQDVLLKKKNMSSLLFPKLCLALEKVYLCYEPEDILGNSLFSELTSYKPKPGELPVDALLKILKWMFIEQDIRDWNYSGRKMLMEGIKEVCNS
jgi:hypothetical protein